MSDFACDGRRSATILGHLVHQGYDRGGIVWSDKNQAPFPPRRNTVNHVDSSQSEMSCKNITQC